MLSTWFTRLSASLALLMLIPQPTTELKILGLFPHPGKSHVDVFSPLLRGLANKGHEVTVVSYFSANKPIPGYKDISLQHGDMPVHKDIVDLDLFSHRSAVNHLQEFFMLTNLGLRSCEVALSAPGVQDLLKSTQKFDVIISELFISDCMLGLVHHFQAPNIAISSCNIMPWAHGRFGNIDNPSYVPITFFGYSTPPMTFKQRMTSFLNSQLLKILYFYFSERPTDVILKKYFGDIPSVSELKYNTSMLFVNTHYTLTGVRPLVPAVLEIGGIHIQPAKPLDRELEKFISEAEHGVVYVSWGSMIRTETLPKDKRLGLLEAFGLLKQRVIWKWENETLPGKPANVLIRKWMPQIDILAHPNIRVFMTHGGLLGMTEAAHYGVPVVSTPLYGDQFLNTASLIARGMGVELPYEDISKEAVLEALNTILEPRFKENATLVASSFNSRPMKPLDLAIWWVEQVARTNGEHMIMAPFATMSWIQYTLLDVVGVLFGAIFLIAFITWKVLRRIKIRNKDDKQKKL